MRESRADVVVVGGVVLPLDRVHGDAVIRHERRGGVVLGRERIGGAEEKVRSCRRERPREVRGFGRHVEAGRQPHAGERLLLLESLPDPREHGHARVGPLDLELAGGRERQVADVMRRPAGDRGRHRDAGAAACTSTPAAAARSAARSTRSHENSGRPKCPKAAVAL